MIIANVPASTRAATKRAAQPREVGVWGAHRGPVRGTVDRSAAEGGNRHYRAKKPNEHSGGKRAARPGQATPQRPVRSSG